MRGLKAERKGANPVLHLPIAHLLGDPEAWVILQTIRDARELAHSRVEALLGLFAHAEDLPRNGPTAILKARVERVGWTIGGNGLIQDGLGTFSLLSIGWDELLLRFTLAWGWVMHQAVQHRPSFHGIQQVDLAELQLALKACRHGGFAVSFGRHIVHSKRSCQVPARSDGSLSLVFTN